MTIDAARVAELAQRAFDELTIMRTLSRLAQAQDNLDRDAYKSCFTPTVRLTAAVMFKDWQPQDITVDQLTDDYFSGLERYDAGHHVVVNHIIDVTGDDASCIADLLGIAVLDHGDGSTQTSMLGARYDLRLRRVGEEWRIYQRGITARYRGDGYPAFLQSLAAREHGSSATAEQHS